MKRIKIKKLKVDKNRKNKVIPKIGILTLIFIFGIYLTNSEININMLASISNNSMWLLTNNQLLANIDKMEDTKTVWPLQSVTSWWNTDNYELDKWTYWNKLDDYKKKAFPQNFSTIMNKYRYLPVTDVWSHISNPLERENILFFKRLLTTSRTASYNLSEWWIPETWTHAWLDFVSSMWTPVYSSMNWIVLKKSEPCPWSIWSKDCSGFGNYITIATNFDEEVIAIFYAHMDYLENLKEWDIVKRWQLIWKLWSSWNSTAPHLHFQINKLWKISDIKNIDVAKTLFNDRYHDLDWVKRKTLDPIVFIEDNLVSLDDGFQETNTKIDIEENTHSSAPEKEKFLIKNIVSSKIDDKLTIWDQITLKIQTEWDVWNISITTKNDVIRPSKYLINKIDWIDEYIINLTANNIGNWEVILNDGKNKKSYYFSVYNDTVEIYWLAIEWNQTIYTSNKSKFNIYPVDNLWNKINTKFDWKIKVRLQDKESDEYVLNTSYNVEDKSFLEMELQAPKVADYKLKITYYGDEKTLFANKNLSTEIFYDYSYNDKYWTSIKNLNEKEIVQWYKWLLSPKDSLYRSEIITTLIRYRYWDKLEDFTDQMNQYMITNWKFFQDINGEERYAPYIYMWFKDWIIKWSNWRALPNEYINKAELITVYGRFFGIKQNSIFTNWLDIESGDWYKAYADSSKNYNLYPFGDTSYFKATEIVNRENSFESLRRYINFDKSSMEIINENNIVNNDNESYNDINQTLMNLLWM